MAVKQRPQAGEPGFVESLVQQVGHLLSSGRIEQAQADLLLETGVLLDKWTKEGVAPAEIVRRMAENVRVREN